MTDTTKQDIKTLATALTVVVAGLEAILQPKDKDVLEPVRAALERVKENNRDHPG